MNKRINQSGFTLLELLVTIAIISSLAVIVFTALKPKQRIEQAKDNKFLQDLKSLETAVNLKRVDDPISLNTCAGSPPTLRQRIGSGDYNLAGCLIPTYFKDKIPVNPIGGSWISQSNYDAALSIKLDPDTGLLSIKKSPSYNYAYSFSFDASASPGGNLTSPFAIAVGPDKKIYVTEKFTARVVVFSESGQYLTQFGTAGIAALNIAPQFSNAEGIVVSPDNKIFIADGGANKILIVNGSTYLVENILTGSSSYLGSSFSVPHHLSYSPLNGNLYVTEQSSYCRTRIFNASNNYAAALYTIPSTWTTITGACQNDDLHLGRESDRGISFANNGNAYVADTANHRVLIYNSSNTLISAIANGGLITNTAGSTTETAGFAADGESWFEFPTDVDVAGDGTLFVADNNSLSGNRVQIFTSSGQYRSSFGSTGTGPGQFMDIQSLAINEDNTVYVVDYTTGKIIAFTPI